MVPTVVYVTSHLLPADAFPPALRYSPSVVSQPVIHIQHCVEVALSLEIQVFLVEYVFRCGEEYTEEVKQKFVE
jgi:hypothetical protein